MILDRLSFGFMGIEQFSRLFRTYENRMLADYVKEGAKGYAK